MKDHPLPSNVRKLGDGSAPPPAPNQPQIEPPDSPNWLDRDASETFEETAELLIAANRWQPHYVHALATYSTLWAEFRADPRRFSPGKLQQLRQYQLHLSLVPSAKSRSASTGRFL